MAPTNPGPIGATINTPGPYTNMLAHRAARLLVGGEESLMCGPRGCGKYKYFN